METWAIWGSLAAVIIILELLSGTFYLLMISTGFIIASLVAYSGGSTSAQFILGTLVSAVGTIALHKSRFGSKNKREVNNNPNVNIDIGQTLEVKEWKQIGDHVYAGSGMYRGANWQIETHTQHIPQAGVFKIIEVSSNKLIVKAN